MKNHLKKALFIGLTTIFASSCAKDVNSEYANGSETGKTESLTDKKVSMKPPKEVKAIYYLDYKEVGIDDLGLKNPNVAVTGKQENDVLFVIFNAFTTEQAFIDFGKHNNIKIEEMIGFERAMQDRAKELGIIDIEYQKGIKLPKEYTDYEATMYLKYFGRNITSKTVFTTFHKDYTGGPSWVTGSTMPHWGVIGWNNQISSYFPLGIYGFTSFYDDSFYRNRMLTAWDWGWQRIPLFWGWTYLANDRTTSTINY